MSDLANTINEMEKNTDELSEHFNALSNINDQLRIDLEKVQKCNLKHIEQAQGLTAELIKEKEKSIQLITENNILKQKIQIVIEHLKAKHFYVALDILDQK